MKDDNGRTLLALCTRDLIEIRDLAKVLDAGA